MKLISCIKTKIILFAFAVIILPSFTYAATGLTYHGRILKPGGQPLEAANVFFHIQIRSPNTDNCLLYDEQQTLNMSASAGIFVLTIGEGTRVLPAVDGGHSISRLFANRGTMSGLTCSFGNSYAPGVADGRKLQVQFNDGSGWQALPAQNINYVPLAIEAVQIGGYGTGQILRVADGVTATEFSNANWNELWALITGASTVYQLANGSNFNPTAAVDFNSQKIIDLADPTLAQDAATKNYSDTNIGGKAIDVSTVSNLAGNGHVLVWDQGQNRWETSLPSDATKLPLAGGTMTGSISLGGTHSITNIGHVSIADQGTLYLGKFTTAQETTLLATPLNATTDRGRTWFNVTTGKMRIWNGSAASDVGADLGYTPVNKAGDTMSGLLVLSADPSAALGAATKQYVDSTVTTAGGAFVKKDGSVAMTGNLMVGANYIGNDGGTEGLFFDASGRATILNTNASVSPALKLDNASTAVGSGNSLLFENGIVNQLELAQEIMSAGNSDFYISSLTGNVVTEKLRIASSGNVGIGTASPNQLLTVEGVTSLRETAAPVLTANYGKIYVKSADSKLYYMDDSGAETQLGSASGALANVSSVSNTAGVILNSDSDNASSDGGFNFQRNGSNLLTINNAGDVNITSTTVSSNYGNGALVVAGGLGVGSSINAAGNILGITSGNGVYTGSSAASQYPNSASRLGMHNNNSADDRYSSIVLGSQNAAGNTQYSYIVSKSETGAGIYSPAMAFGTSNGATAYTERMRIDSSGYVGIGTTAPNQLLTVEGITSLREVASAPAASANYGKIYVKTDSKLYFMDDGGTEKELGTASGALSNVSSVSNTAGVTFNSDSDNAASDGGFNFQRNGSNLLTINNAGDIAISSTTASTTTGTGAIVVGGGIGTGGSINAGGRVSSAGGFVTMGGVNLAYTPTSAALTRPYESNSQAPVVLVRNTSSVDGGGSFVTLGSNNGSANIQHGYIGAISTTGAGVYSPSIVFGQQTGATAYSERMRISSDGNIGIGTTAPGLRFEVVDSSTAAISAIENTYNSAGSYAALRLRRSRADATAAAAGMAGGIEFYTEGNTDGAYSVTGRLMNGWETTPNSAPNRNGFFAFETITGGTLSEKVRISAAGNVGIGTAAPVEKLDVDGGIKISNTAQANAGTLRWTGVNFQGYDGSAWFNILPNPPAAGACDTTQTFNSTGVHAYTVPAGFATVTVRLWGGGGSGGGTNSGGASSIVSLGITANGGAAGVGSTGGTGGTASGGTINLSGANGGNATNGSGQPSGTGGASPNGGAGGNSVSGNWSTGPAGGIPGGGAGGSTQDPGRNGGGGGGAYAEKTFTPVGLSAGTTINDIIVGAGGVGGGTGGNGRISITCSTTGAPPVNDRSILFQDSGAYSASTTFVYDTSGNVGLGTATPNERLTVEGTTSLRELASAPAVTANYGKIYVKSSDSKLYFMDAAGVETAISGGYGSGSIITAGAGTVAAPSLSFSAEPDTGLYSNGANTIGVSAGNSNIFNLSSLGLVSTTTGGASASTANGTAAAPTFSFKGDEDTGWYRATADTLAASTAGSERMRIASNGNVGIGTVTPAGLFEVSSLNGAVQETVRITNTSSAAGSGSNLAFGGNSSIRMASIGNVIEATTTDSSLTFNTRQTAGNPTEKMRITAAGNVGIGTSSPVEKLDVNGAVKLGISAGNAAGTIRWNGTNFQGSDGTSWFNIMPNPPAAGGCDQTQVFNTPGTHGYTVPAGYATLTVKVWGGGGAGGNWFGTGPGVPGGSSTITSLGLGAGGGSTGGNYSGAPTAGGVGGTATGGTVNTSGNSGGTGTANVTSGSGGAAPGGGGGGGGGVTTGSGIVGGSPGGGGSGGLPSGGSTPTGGGSGGYVEKTFTPGALPPGTTINDIVVGAGGQPINIGHPAAGGFGGNGQVSISCSTTGTPSAIGWGSCSIAAFAATSGSNSKTCTGVSAGTPVYCSPTDAPAVATVTWGARASAADTVDINLSADFTTSTTWKCMFFNP